MILVACNNEWLTYAMERLLGDALPGVPLVSCRLDDLVALAADRQPDRIIVMVGLSLAEHIAHLIRLRTEHPQARLILGVASDERLYANLRLLSIFDALIDEARINQELVPALVHPTRLQ